MPRGGKRTGAGRPLGAKNVLPQGCVAAVRAAGLRVPATASDAERALADRALCRLADVLEGNVHPAMAFPVLQAGRLLREEICGPVPKKLEHGGPNGAPLEVMIREV